MLRLVSRIAGRHPAAPSTTAYLFRTMESSAVNAGPVQVSIVDKLKSALHPTHLDVINESHMHNVPENSETHFKVVVVSEKFVQMGKNPLARHRLIHNLLEKELSQEGSVHALSIVAKTPEQWQAMVDAGKAAIPPSPNCRGGDGSLPPKNSK